MPRNTIRASTVLTSQPDGSTMGGLMFNFAKCPLAIMTGVTRRRRFTADQKRGRCETYLDTGA